MVRIVYGSSYHFERYMNNFISECTMRRQLLEIFELLCVCVKKKPAAFSKTKEGVEFGVQSKKKEKKHNRSPNVRKL